MLIEIVGGAIGGAVLATSSTAVYNFVKKQAASAKANAGVLVTKAEAAIRADPAKVDAAIKAAAAKVK